MKHVSQDDTAVSPLHSWVVLQLTRDATNASGRQLNHVRQDQVLIGTCPHGQVAIAVSNCNGAGPDCSTGLNMLPMTVFHEEEPLNIA